MIRIAILADIHGNMPAFEAVQADIGQQSVDEVMVGGDLVGRGPQGSAVVRSVVELGWPCVRGNHEDYLLAFRRGEVPAEWQSRDEWTGARWMAAELDESALRYLESLPLTMTSQLAPQVRLVHGSPGSNNDGIGPWTSESRIVEHLQAIDERVLVCGHTHRPLHWRLDSGQVINVGSVGLPFNGDRRAQYAVLEIGSGTVEVEFRQVEYDLDRILDIYESSGFLAAGGATARLLRMEIEHAVPFLVPFLQWAEARGVPPASSQIEVFCEFYDPHDSFHSFFARLRQLQNGGGV
jgi:putative phosphoesterase